jgi:hypothetical protein
MTILANINVRYLQNFMLSISVFNSNLHNTDGITRLLISHIGKYSLLLVDKEYEAKLRRKGDMSPWSVAKQVKEKLKMEGTVIFLQR